MVPSAATVTCRLSIRSRVLMRRVLCILTAVAGLGRVGEASALDAKRGFDLQGHRGARGLAPENTLVAFARALSLGVTTLELDLAVTRDGVVVVSHDPLVNPDVTRGPGGEWMEKHGPPFFSLAFDEVRRLDVGRLRPGTAYAAQFPDQVPSDGTRIPTLAEVYALARKAGNETVRFNIETKLDPTKPDQSLGPEPFVDAVLKVVRAAESASRTTLQSFDWRTLQYAQKIAPDLTTVYLTEQQGHDQIQAGRPGASPWLAGFDVDDHGGSIPRLVKAAGGRVWSPLFRDLTRESLAEAHRLGLTVIPWTVNRAQDMESMIEWGVDGFITDRPDLGRATLARRNVALPAATPVSP
jgi:glycerophosphoryl diester phosphodiesterase